MLGLARQDALELIETYEDFRFSFYNFVGAAKEAGMAGPQAYLATVPPGKSVQAHFHPVDQFQVFFPGGQGAFFERYPLASVHVQYADAYTPYGPFGAGDGEHRLEFFTLRAQATREHHTMPGARDKMLRPPDRSLHATLALSETAGKEVTTTTLFEKADGLRALHLRVPPGASALAPPPAHAGQYCVVVRGVMDHAGKPHQAQSCLFLEAGEPPLTVSASPHEGCDVVLLQFPPKAR